VAGLVVFVVFAVSVVSVSVACVAYGVGVEPCDWVGH
jgi:hypothetical protein